MAATAPAPLANVDIGDDPTASEVATSCLDFLLIELVPMAYRITADLAAREESYFAGSSAKEKEKDKEGDASSTRGGATTVAGTAVDEEEAREAVFHRLETLGYRVGLGVVERISRGHPRPTSALATIKFLCKDLWTLLFRKQIDNLKTNHRGIYVLTDNTFKPLTRMAFDGKKHTPAQQAAAVAAIQARDPEADVSAFRGDSNSLSRAQPFLYFPAGVVRGCLAGLGVEATVNAETTSLPGAVFQIKTVGAKA